jgi:hypothetical protein
MIFDCVGKPAGAAAAQVPSKSAHAAASGKAPETSFDLRDRLTKLVI